MKYKFLVQKMAQKIDENPTNLMLRKDYVNLKLDESLAEEMADKYFWNENIKIKKEESPLKKLFTGFNDFYKNNKK